MSEKKYLDYEGLTQVVQRVKEMNLIPTSYYAFKDTNSNGIIYVSFDLVPGTAEHAYLLTNYDSSQNVKTTATILPLLIEGEVTNFTRLSETSFSINKVGVGVVTYSRLEGVLPFVFRSELETNKSVSISVPSYSEPVVIEPTAGHPAMEAVTLNLTDIPVLEANKQVEIDLWQTTGTEVIFPTAGSDAMEQVTATLTNIPNCLYAWLDEDSSHYLYTTFPDIEKSNGIGYQCGTIKNAPLLEKSVVASGEALYIDGWPDHLYYRYPEGDITYRT